MYKTHAKIKRCLSCCPLYGGCPHLGGSVKGGSTVCICTRDETAPRHKARGARLGKWCARTR